MNKHLSKIISLSIMVWMFAYNPGNLIAADNESQGKTNGTSTAKVGYLENVLLEKLSGKERVNLVVSQQTAIQVTTKYDGSLSVKLENMFVPENLRRTLGEGQLVNIIDVIPQQQAADGKQWIELSIHLKEKVPYVVRQEGGSVFIDFNVSGLAVNNKKVASPKKSTQRANAETASAANEDAVEIKPKKESPKRFTDRMISLDFQEADIKSVLRLMAEYGNISIVSGDDVKGNVTLSMKNVPWDQALDSILDVHGLAKKQMGDVISVMTLERKKKDESDKKAAEEDQRKAEDQRKDRELQVLVEKGKLRQILIEAKIVEATEEFVRKLGVTWGFANKQSVGSYGLGAAGGSNTKQSNAQAVSYPSQFSPDPWAQAGSTATSALPLYMAAVNLPSALAAPTLGVVFGGAAGFIEAQLAALESNQAGKIISSPKVVTMDNVKAVIKQGDEVPYVTPASGNSPATVTFKEALLKLEVKPKITDEGRISMEIKATKDTPDYATGITLQGNPPINKNEVESKIVVQDGDTVVIGGVTRTQDDKIVSGLPWLQKIPVLGWLFKTEDIHNTKKQLLIFITPKILKGSSFVESEEKTIH
jgi:type IV pilus assembly protein PilQ